MITVAQAEKLVSDSVEPEPEVECSLAEAPGRILRAPVQADRDTPPFDRVMMDGFAISHDSWRQGRRSFRVEAIVPAGSRPAGLTDPANAIEVMTGGVVPPACDVVVPVEWCVLQEGEVRVAPPEDRPVEKWTYVHRAGSQGQAGRTVLSPGCRLGPAEMAVAATEGGVRLFVNRVPRVHLITTGDEIVPPDASPTPWQIRGSHAVSLQTLFRQWGPVHWSHCHAADRDRDLSEAFADALENADILMVTGGVSRGRWDRVPDVLEDCGVEAVFHRVAQRPGKPLWFGCRGRRLVFGLPGNPFSALCTARRYVWPALDRWCGGSAGDRPLVALGEAITPWQDLTSFLLVRWLRDRVAPVSPGNSGDLHALCGTAGFVECPPGLNSLPAGESLPFYSWRT